MARPRILVLEDDPGIQRFIALTLAEKDLELLPCHTLAAARAALAAAPAQLVLMDMTLPDGSGLELLNWLREKHAADVRAGRIVVLSGGVDAAAQQQLLALGVWRVLHKPVSVAALLACAEEALGMEVAQQQPTNAVQNPQVVGDPLVEFFAGNRTLYEAYRSLCIARLAGDVREGDEALRVGDAQALRHVTHNLKSLLRMLGYVELSQLAGAIEEVAGRGDPFAQAQWHTLRTALLQLAKGATSSA